METMISRRKTIYSINVPLITGRFDGFHARAEKWKKKLKTYLFKHSYFWTLNIIFSTCIYFYLSFSFIYIFILSALIIVMDRCAI